MDGDLSPERADRFLARLFWKVRWLIHLPSSLNAIISHSVPSNELSSSARIPTKYDVVPTTIDTTCRRREFAHNPSSVCVDSSLRVCNFPQHGESNTAAVHARRVSVCMGAHPWRVRQCILLSVCSLLLHVLLRATCSLSPSPPELQESGRKLGARMRAEGAVERVSRVRSIHGIDVW